MLNALRQHWPEYLIEAACLGLFMVSACMFGTLFEHPGSPFRQAVSDPFLRRIPMGLAMGLTAMGLIYSALGQRSGAHMNPSVTLTFFRLGKLAGWDAVFYALAQFVGGIAGGMLSAAVLRGMLAHPAVNYVATLPGSGGAWTAFAAEVVISFLLMTVVLRASNSRTLTRWTGLFSALLVATYITFEAPFSGMSMNPARTLGSAVPGQIWTALWVYFTAPPLGMLLAAEVYARTKGPRAVYCAKFNHLNNKRCIFRCRFGELGV